MALKEWGLVERFREQVRTTRGHSPSPEPRPNKRNKGKGKARDDPIDLTQDDA